MSWRRNALHSEGQRTLELAIDGNQHLRQPAIACAQEQGKTTKVLLRGRPLRRFRENALQAKIAEPNLSRQKFFRCRAGIVKEPKLFSMAFTQLRDFRFECENTPLLRLTEQHLRLPENALRP